MLAERYGGAWNSYGPRPVAIPLAEVSITGAEQTGIEFRIPQQYGGGQFTSRPNAIHGRINDQPASTQIRNLWNIVRGR